MDSVMVASFIDELQKIAGGNVMTPALQVKPPIGGMGSNIMAKPLPTPGIGKQTKDPSAKVTNYSIVNQTTPPTAFHAGSATAPAPPSVRT